MCLCVNEASNNDSKGQINQPRDQFDQNPEILQIIISYG